MLQNLLFQKNKDEILEDGYKILNKTRESVQNDVAIVTEWLKTQKHLPEIASPAIIENLLKINKFSIEVTKQKINMYYSIRKILPEIFHDKHPLSPHMQEFRKNFCCVPLPKLTDEVQRVTIMKLLNNNPDKYDPYLHFAYLFSISEIRLNEDCHLSNIIVIDLTGLSFKHVTKFTPVNMRRASLVIENVYGNRISKFHIVNCPLGETIVTLLKQVLNPKLQERFVIHKDPSTLKEYIPVEILPKDYGGEELSVNELNDLWQLKFEQWKDRFDKLDKMEVNEELRPVPLKNDEILGFHGNFKTLNVD